MAGSANAPDIRNLIAAVDATGIVTGRPGSWAISPFHLALFAGEDAKVRYAAVGMAASPITAGQAAVLDAAVTKSNAAAKTTPSAATGNATTGNSTASTIENAAKGLTAFANTPGDIEALQVGAEATLHWWGWSLKLTDNGTKALDRLLKSDIPGLLAILTALTGANAPFAAAAGIIGALSTALDQFVTTGNKGNGVTLSGYAWIVIWVDSN